MLLGVICLSFQSCKCIIWSKFKAHDAYHTNYTIQIPDMLLLCPMLNPNSCLTKTGWSGLLGSENFTVVYRNDNLWVPPMWDFWGYDFKPIDPGPTKLRTTEGHPVPSCEMAAPRLPELPCWEGQFVKKNTHLFHRVDLGPWEGLIWALASS